MSWSRNKDKPYRIRLMWSQDGMYWNIMARSEEDAVEKFKEAYHNEILNNWMIYRAEELEDEE